MRFFAKIVTALLVGCFTAAGADQTKSELGKLFNALRESDNLVEMSQIQNRFGPTGMNFHGTLGRYSLSLIKALTLCSRDRLSTLLPNSAR